jgi:hypothetical protein
VLGRYLSFAALIFLAVELAVLAIRRTRLQGAQKAA